MFSVVALCAVVDVVKHNDTGNEVNSFARRKEVHVGPAVPSSIPIADVSELR